MAVGLVPQVLIDHEIDIIWNETARVVTEQKVGSARVIALKTVLHIPVVGRATRIVMALAATVPVYRNGSRGRSVTIERIHPLWTFLAHSGRTSPQNIVLLKPSVIFTSSNSIPRRQNGPENRIVSSQS